MIQQRIVECVNACQGLENPAEDIKALVKAAKKANNRLDFVYASEFSRPKEEVEEWVALEEALSKFKEWGDGKK